MDLKTDQRKRFTKVFLAFNRLAFAMIFFSVNIDSAQALNSEFHVRVDSSLIQAALNTVSSSLSNSSGEISQTLQNFSQEIDFNLKDLQLDQDLVELAKDLGKVDLNGKGKIRVLLESPRIKGTISFGEPIFLKRQDGKFDVSASLYIKNFSVGFKHIWFTASGAIGVDPLSEKNCHQLIASDAVLGQDFLLNSSLARDKLKIRLKNFYQNLNHETFKGHEGKLWARLDGLQAGWATGQSFKDRRNLYIARINLLVDPRKNGSGIELTSFTHNLGKKNGSWIPVYIPTNGIIIPPTFIRTTSRKIDGNLISDDEITRCTFVENNPIQDVIAEFARKAARDITINFSNESVHSIVNYTRSTLATIKMNNIPDQLVITNEDLKSFKDSHSCVIQQDLDFDFNKDLYGIIQNFTKYRASLGLDGIETGSDGKSLQLGLQSDLRIDGKKLTYKENYLEPNAALPSEYKWTEGVGSSNAYVAISGNFLNKIINPIKNHFIKTNTPPNFNVMVNDDLFDIDHMGWVTIKPKIELAYEDIDLIRVTFEVKAKPEIFHGQDNRSWLKLKLNVPNAHTIISNIRPSSTVTTVETFANILLGPAFTQTVKASVIEKIRSEVQKYIDDINNNTKDIEITPFIREYGIVPVAMHFKKLKTDNYMELMFNVKKFPGLVEATRGLAP
jgi:hypothetical protein